MKKARHTYITISSQFEDRVFKHIEIARKHFGLGDGELYFSVNYYKRRYKNKYRESVVLNDTIFNSIINGVLSDLKEDLNKPILEIDGSFLTKIQELSPNNRPQYLHIPISLRDDGEYFFFSESNEKQVQFISINIIMKHDVEFDVRMFRHYLETELREEYTRFIIETLIEAAKESETTTEFSDPSDLFTLYVDVISNSLPDVDIVYWKGVSKRRILQCDLSSDVRFDCDILDVGSAVLEFFRTGDDECNYASANVLQLAKSEVSGDGVFNVAYDFGWRSVALRRIYVNRNSAGVLGFFTRYSTSIPAVYSVLIDIFSSQTARFIAEKQRLEELFTLKDSLKKLVPLMALGNEVVHRNHDIRDQVNIVKNCLLSVRDDDESSKSISREATIGLNAIEHMQDVLSKQLQTFKSAKQARKKIRLDELLDEVIQRMNVLSGIANVRLKKQLENDLFVSGQKFYLERVFENLIGNAIYYSKQAVGENLVKVVGRCEQKYNIIEIVDNGPGISQIPIEKIYELGETTKPEGFGIGLHIAKEIISEHEGQIEARNRLNGGAKFTVMFPRYLY